MLCQCCKVTGISWAAAAGSGGAGTAKTFFIGYFEVCKSKTSGGKIPLLSHILEGQKGGNICASTSKWHVILQSSRAG